MRKAEQLITVYFDGVLSPEDYEKLIEWLRSDPANIEHFVYASYIHRSMYDILHGQDTQKLLNNRLDSEGICNQNFWNALLDSERTAPAREPETKSQILDKVIPDRSNIQMSRGNINRFAWITALSALAAMVFLLIYVHVNPKQVSEPAAIVTDVIETTPGSSGPLLRPGARLLTRSGLHSLDQGIIKMRFDNGVDIVIEAPALFEILTYDEISLHTGRLYAQVPHRSVGFIVSTPNSKVIDLGTAFGVYADVHGNTDIHVMVGEVSVVSGTRSDVRDSELLSESQACRVEMDSEVIHPIPFRREAFVQDILSKTNFIWRGQPLDLADIVGGGNGLGTGRTDMCIDIETGKLTRDVPLARLKRKAPYVLTPEVDYIDGVFLPDGRGGPIQVTSEGHQYACAQTLGESYYGIFNGSVLPLRTGDRGYIDHSIQYRGQVFGTAERPALFLHSNLGVTFDLDQIRKSLPTGGQITRFTASCAISQGPEGSMRTEDYSDFYVLVDGDERFAAVNMNYLSDMKTVELELKETDRFLTLMTTEGRDKSLHLGWSFFAEPRLYIELPTDDAQ